jgi:hypothetical protein
MNVHGALRKWPLAATAALALAAAGCSDKDDNPAGTGGSVELDMATVEDQAVSTMDFVNGLVDGVDEMAAGDFSNVGADLGLPASAFREEATAQWDPQQQAWIYDVDGTETDEFGTASYDVYFRVEFWAGSNAQQNPDGTTTQMNVSLVYSFDWHIQDEQSTLDMNLDYDMDLSVGGLQSTTYEIDGDGDIGVSLAASGQDIQGTQRADLDMAWLTSVAVPSDGGCASGTATVSVENWTFNAQYDGLGTYYWVMYESGRQVDSGSEPVACAAPAS